MKRAVFVTGTDTGVGKTVVSAFLCKKWNAGYWKPVQSGNIEDLDRETVQRLTGLSDDHFYLERYSLREPLSPHAAAKIDGVEIHTGKIELPPFAQDTLIVEGAGGVLVPLNDQHLIIDLIEQLATPTIVVARSTLGTINHTLLTLQALRSRNINILGVIMNGPRNQGNADAIRQYGRTQILAQLEMMEFNELCDTNNISDLASIHANEDSRNPAVCAAR